MIEFPDFDFNEFYNLAMKINDFLNDPDFEKWAKIIVESLACKEQVKFFRTTKVLKFRLD